MRCLAIGGAGFIGPHLVRRPSERGDEMIRVDQMAQGTGGRHPSAGWLLFYRPSVGQDLAIDATFWRWARQATPGCFSSSVAYPVRLQIVHLEDKK